MGFRTVNGNTHSEDGWPLVDQGSCTWVKVPGAEHVSLQIQNGQPLILLRAWAADWNAHIEPLRDADSACWTAGNSVLGQPGENNGSNHLGGTAIDLNWGSHPFRQRGSLNAAQMRVMEEMEDFYEGTVFWAGRWDNPADEMHSQCGYNSFNNPHTADFIARKIRADGFSTFRRDNGPVPPPPLSQADQYALLIIAEGRRRGISERGIKIALATGLVESNIKVYANSKVPDSFNYPHDAVGSDGFSVGIFQQQVRDTGNGWWWGDAQTCMDPTTSAALFYNRLATLDYNGPNSPGSYAQAVQQSAFPDRYDQRFAEAEQLFDRLNTTTEPLDPWEELMADSTEYPSLSMYDDGTDKDTLAGRVRRSHAFLWDIRVEDSALRGELWAIGRVAKAAAGSDEFLSNHAKAVLADIETKNPAALQQFLNGAN